jgi:hypothetical protein
MTTDKVIPDLASTFVCSTADTFSLLHCVLLTVVLTVVVDFRLLLTAPLCCCVGVNLPVGTEPHNQVQPWNCYFTAISLATATVQFTYSSQQQ